MWEKKMLVACIFSLSKSFQLFPNFFFFLQGMFSMSESTLSADNSKILFMSYNEVSAPVHVFLTFSHRAMRQESCIRGEGEKIFAIVNNFIYHKQHSTRFQKRLCL